MALISDLTIEEARKALDGLVSRGHAAMKVNKSGVIIYHIPDFLDHNTTEAFEDL